MYVCMHKLYEQLVVITHVHDLTKWTLNTLIVYVDYIVYPVNHIINILYLAMRMGNRQDRRVFCVQ